MKYNFIEIILLIFELLNNPIGITSIIRNIVFDNVHAMEQASG